MLLQLLSSPTEVSTEHKQSEDFGTRNPRQHAHVTDSGITFEESGSIPGILLKQGISWSSSSQADSCNHSAMSGNIIKLAKGYFEKTHNSMLDQVKTRSSQALCIPASLFYGRREPAVTFLPQSYFSKEGAVPKGNTVTSCKVQQKGQPSMTGATTDTER